VTEPVAFNEKGVFDMIWLNLAIDQERSQNTGTYYFALTHAAFFLDVAVHFVSLGLMLI
jgi:hypothetical protein